MTTTTRTMTTRGPPDDDDNDGNNDDVDADGDDVDEDAPPTAHLLSSDTVLARSPVRGGCWHSLDHPRPDQAVGKPPPGARRASSGWRRYGVLGQAVVHQPLRLLGSKPARHFSSSLRWGTKKQSTADRSVPPILLQLSTGAYACYAPPEPQVRSEPKVYLSRDNDAYICDHWYWLDSTASPERSGEACKGSTNRAGERTD